MVDGERDYSHRSLMQKLGVEPGMRVSVLGVADAVFLSDLASSGADVSTRKRKDTDIFIVAVERLRDMDQLAPLEPLMLRNGGIWVVHPKGRKDVSGADIIALGVEAGFVDNKGCAFSETHTALRFVIPKSRR
jgi:hypothetical protein